MIGGFQVGPFQLAYQQGTPAPAAPVAPPPASLGGSKRKIRGPYSDPRIFEEYIKRCIAEREAPRENVAVAVLKESLIEQVAARGQGGVGADLLISESQVIERLIELENTKRALAALKARQRQITKQLEELEDEETSILLALWNALED